MASKRAYGWAIVPLLLGLPLIAAADQGDSPEPRDAGTSPDGPGLAVFDGASVLHLQGACAPGLRCLGRSDTTAGSFLLSGGGSLGTATITWTPVDATAKRLRVSIRSISAEGESPIVLDIGTLPAGPHRVEVAPVAGAVGAYDQRIDWRVSFLVQETPAPLVVNGLSYYGRTIDPGTFFAPWPVREARFYAEWTSGREIEWEVPGRRLVATSPLSLELGALAPAEYAVAIRPVGGLPLDEETARWAVVLER